MGQLGGVCGRYSHALRSSLRNELIPLLFGVPLLAFGAFGLQTLGYQLSRSAGFSALMMPLEIPLATALQVLLFGLRSVDGLSILGTALIICSIVLNGAYQDDDAPRAGAPQAGAPRRVDEHSTLGGERWRRKMDWEDEEEEAVRHLGRHSLGAEGGFAAVGLAAVRDPLADVDEAAFEAETEQLEAEAAEGDPLLGRRDLDRDDHSRGGLLPWEKRRTR